MRQQTANFVFDRLSRGKLSVFLFHKLPIHPDPLAPNEIDLRSFSSLLDLLLKHFRIIPLADALHCLQQGKLPARTACITFDDGYRDWRRGVAETLLKRNVPATFFVCTGQFDGLPMWHERILHVVRTAKMGLIFSTGEGSEKFRLDREEDRLPLAIGLQKILKYQSLTRRNEILMSFEELVGARAADSPAMPVDDLKYLHSKGFEIGAHTKDHPILTCCDPMLAGREIHSSREELENLIGGSVTSFAYPNGRPGTDFGTEHIKAVRSAGFRCALTTDWGTAQAHSSLFQIPRFTPWGPTPLRTYAQLVRNFLAPVNELTE